MPATARKPKASRPRNNDPLVQPSFLRARRGELPYKIEGYVSDFDNSDDDEFSEWIDATVRDSDERECWDLASEVLRHGFKITVRVSKGNSVRVATMVVSRLTHPALAAYCSETETLTFYSQTCEEDLLAALQGDQQDKSAAHKCRCGTRQ